MRSVAFEEIKLALLKLPSEERAELSAWCKGANEVCGRTKAKPVEKTSESFTKRLQPISDDDWLAHAIGRALIKRGLVRRNSANAALAIASAKLTKYSGNSIRIRQFLTKAMGGEVSEYQKVHLGDLVVAILIKHLERVPAIAVQGIGPKLLLSNINLIPQALDGELPGYVQNGMLYWALPHSKR